MVVFFWGVKSQALPNHDNPIFANLGDDYQDGVRQRRNRVRQRQKVRVEALGLDRMEELVVDKLGWLNAQLDGCYSELSGLAGTPSSRSRQSVEVKNEQ